MLKVENLSAWDGKRKVLDDVSFDLKRGEILGVGGLLGAGRTELLETLFGARGASYQGEITLEGKGLRPVKPQDGVRNGLALITEDRKGNGLILDRSISSNVALPLMPLQSRFGRFSEAEQRKQALQAIETLKVAATGPDHPVGKLSGGNQQKVVLGKWLATQPRVLLLDEPTRGIDIGAKDEIYDLVGRLADQGISVLFASSELSEFMAVCDRMIVLCEGQMAGELSRKEMSVDSIKALAMQFR